MLLKVYYLRRKNVHKPGYAKAITVVDGGTRRVAESVV